jgi:hypothetical protein
LRVEQGGVGSRTRIDLGLKVAGIVNRITAVIEEPEPGKVLAEVAPDGRMRTVFTVAPEGEDRCRVRMSTEVVPAGGPKGLVEKLILPRFLPKLFADELALLDAYAQSLKAG